MNSGYQIPLLFNIPSAEQAPNAAEYLRRLMSSQSNSEDSFASTASILAVKAKATCPKYSNKIKTTFQSSNPRTMSSLSPKRGDPPGGSDLSQFDYNIAHCHNHVIAINTDCDWKNPFGLECCIVDSVQVKDARGKKTTVSKFVVMIPVSSKQSAKLKTAHSVISTSPVGAGFVLDMPLKDINGSLAMMISTLMLKLLFQKGLIIKRSW